MTLATAGVAALPAPAMASHSQASIIEDFSDAYLPAQTLQQFRALGANTVRVVLPWDLLAPHAGSAHKPSVNLRNPNAYSGWAPYDAIVREAAADGMTVDMTVSGGAPRWAEKQAPPPAPGVNPQYVAWKPNGADYGQFMYAVARRYDGHFTPTHQSSPLPRIHFWAIFNEPNFGQDLGPEASNGSRRPLAAMYYRSLVAQGWRALRATGHKHDTILIGELAAKGSEPHPPTRRWPQGLPGNYAQTRPLLFIRDLYCVNARFQRLRGGAAWAAGCPTTARGSRQFRRRNPALFQAGGFAIHPYDGQASPVSRAGQRADYATFQDFGSLERTLDRVNHVYGSGKHFRIFNTEFGYITNPPVRGQGYASPARAAYWMNWSEYLSWRSGRVASYMQYLLQDPRPNAGAYNGFASGLKFPNGKPKPAYGAYRLAVYMPRTNLRRNASAEVWGNARPAPFMKKDRDGNQFVAIQLNRRTIRTQRVNDGFFDLHMRFPHSGTVRLAYRYPKHDSFLPLTDLGKTVYSRSFRVRVR
ncbi:MAG TPA: hypothetical protein VFN87_17740 [Solirubrobacteraceae bacterium]|nr:hypothetical protein [Solirubrobacteraceae bacterium]